MINTFVNSNFFVALTTVVTALVAWFVYKWQKDDKKVNAAKKILFELRKAEKAIDLLKRNECNLDIIEKVRIMDGNIWDRESYLLISEFDTDEFDSLSQFFDDCKQVHLLLAKYENFFWVSTESKAGHLQVVAIDHLRSEINDGRVTEQNMTSYKDYKNKLMSTLSDEGVPFIPRKIQNDLKAITNRVTPITSTNIGMKLKSIARSGL